MSGSPFGKYLLYERIAAGGMAEIYRAKYVAAAGVTKSVVIKKILPHYAGNRNFVSMFINEAKIAVGLSHGNIAQVFDFGEIDGEYFIAMEFVHGQTVSKILRRAREKGLRIPSSYAAFIAMEMCRGLHYAHTRADESQRPLNIVHRDVSPQNIIVSYEGQVKIVDFGIAKARSASEADKTQAGAIKGKYVYFSPEQARARDLDGRSDVFATGIVLYEMLCGRLPFEGKMIEVLNKIVRGDFPRPSTIAPHIDPQLEALLLKALATSRDDRFTSSLAFQEALAGYLFEIAPRFNQSNLAQLVDYLFQEELAQEGREVQPTESFLSQVNRWRDQELTRAPPAEPLEEVEITSAERGPGRRSAIPTLDSDPALPKHTRSAFASTQVRLGIAVAVFAAAAALGGGAVVYFGRAKSFSVHLSSTPPGLEVRLDGAPTGERTPVTLANLPADRAHMLGLYAPGLKPWTQQVQPARGETVEVNAVLEPAPLGAAGASQGEDLGARDEVAAPAFAPAVAIAPETDLRLDAAAIALSVPASRAARIRLDPRASYSLSVQGEATLDTVAHTRGCFYFVEREANATGPTFGWLGPGDSATVCGARALYGFVVDPSPGDNAGALTLIAREGKRELRLPVDARTNAIFPEPARGGRFTGLASQGRFALELQGRADFGAGAGPSQSAIYWYEGTLDLNELAKSPEISHGVIHAGEQVSLLRPSQVVLFVPDDDTGDNHGALAASVRPASP